MNYSGDSRRLCSGIAVDIVHNSPAVAMCYMDALLLVKQLGRVAIMLAFMLHHTPQAWWVISAMPVLLFIYGFVDPADVKGASEFVCEKTSGVSNSVIEIIQKQEIIADYFQRPQMNS